MSFQSKADKAMEWVVWILLAIFAGSTILASVGITILSVTEGAKVGPGATRYDNQNYLYPEAQCCAPTHGRTVKM